MPNLANKFIASQQKNSNSAYLKGKSAMNNLKLKGPNSHVHNYRTNPNKATNSQAYSGFELLDFGKISIRPQQRMTIQPKLKLYKPGDKYEQEADRMAEQVMQMSDIDSEVISKADSQIKHKCNACEKEEEEKMTQTIRNRGIPSITSSFHTQLNSSKRGGSPLPKTTNQLMSNAFNTDFSSVRIHDDPNAHRMNSDILAKAFTHGSDIFFNRGNYSPGSSEGKRLLAHELTHVVQQQGTYNHVQRKPVFEKNSRCTDFNKCDVVASWDLASKMVAETIKAMDDVIKNGKKSTYHTKVDTYFKNYSKTDALTIKSTLTQIQSELNTIITADCDQSTSCGKKVMASTTCSKSADLNFCILFFVSSDCTEKATAIIHELAHHIVCLITPAVEVTDPDTKKKQKTGDVYKHFPEFKTLTLSQALQNPDSFAMLCQDLSTTRDCFDCSLIGQVDEKKWKAKMKEIEANNTKTEKKK